MTTHAKLSASGSERWLNCPGSVKAEEPYPNTTSIFAQEGSTAHELAEIGLSQCIDIFDFEGQQLPDNNAITVTREMCEYVQSYIDYVRSHPYGYRDIECRVDFSDWVPEGFGTSDAIVINKGVLYVIDLKYGKGIRVNAKENTQLLLYALGAYSDFAYIHDIQRIKMVIVQPRLDHIDEWFITVDDLLKHGARISEQAEQALSDNAPRIPGESQCQWCRAKATCKELAQHVEAVLGGDFDDLDNPDTLTNNQIGRALTAKKLIIGWLDATEQHVIKRLTSGQDFPGFKLVAGRSLRKWADDEEAELSLIRLLGDGAFEHTLLSPAKAEKTLGKKKADQILDLIVKPEGKPTLAPESDPRPAVNFTLNDFESFTDG